MALTYTTLVAEINAYTENAFDASGSANIDTIIRQAEQRIYGVVQLPVIRKTSTATAMVQGTSTWVAPTDFLAPAEFSLTLPSTGAVSFLLNKDVSFIREAFPVPATQGVPTHYAIYTVAATTPFATTILLGPTPDAAYATTLSYYAYPTSITTGATSWLGDNFEAVLLAGCLLEAYIYMKGDADLIASYQKRYDDAIAFTKQLGDGKDRRDTYRSGQVRDPVR